MEMSLPDPGALFHILMSPLDVTRALMFHLFWGVRVGREALKNRTQYGQIVQFSTYLVRSDTGDGSGERRVGSSDSSGSHHGGSGLVHLGREQEHE